MRELVPSAGYRLRALNALQNGVEQPAAARLQWRRMQSRSLGHRAPLLWVLLPFMAGLVAGKHQWLPLTPAWWAVVAALAALASFAHRRAWLPGIATALLLAGATFYDVRRGHLAERETLPPREVHVTLEIDRVFPPKADARSVSGLARIRDPDPHLRELAGQFAYFSIALRRDEIQPPTAGRLEVIGVLQSLPRNLLDGGFDAYLVNQGVNFKLTRARVLRVVGNPSAYQVFCDNMLRRLDSVLCLGVERHETQTDLLRAMLLGRQQALSDSQKTVFRESGTMHLFSISGLHIAVIAAVIYTALSLVRVPSLARFLVGAGLLWLYVDITGGTPSAVRAFLMVTFVQAAFVLRRPGNPIASLALSAVVVLVLDPMQLFTASFQLSYGIVAALLLLGLPLAETLTARWMLFTSLPKVAWGRHHRMGDWLWRKLLESLALGFATTLVGMISGVLIFNLFTPVSILANLVLIPLGSLVIVSGFLALISGLLGLTVVAVVLNHASVLLLRVLESGVRGFVALPGAHHDAAFIDPWLGFAAFTGLLGVMAFGYASNWELKRGGFWTPFAFTALALGLGMRWLSAA